MSKLKGIVPLSCSERKVNKLVRSSHIFLNTLDTTHSNIHQQQTGWNTPQGFMLYLSTDFETRYLLSSCSNQSIDKKFQFSPKFMLNVASSVFRNRWVKYVHIQTLHSVLLTLMSFLRFDIKFFEIIIYTLSSS
jgi:hypothetical protein